MKKHIKKVGLVGILAAALLISPMPRVKAHDYKPLEVTVSAQTAFAEDIKLQWPLDNYTITQRFGENKGEHYGPDGHSGIDFMSEFGAPVKAAANGIVVAKGTDECPNFEQSNCNYSFGNWIMLWHPDLKIHTVYSHLKQKPYKEINEKIWQGKTIGYEGGSGYQLKVTADGRLLPITGDSTAHHLDFMVGVFKIYKTREGKTDYQIIKLYDPLKFLPN